MNPCVLMNKNNIVQYTTPTITITFPTINTSTITEAYLVFKYGGTAILTKALSAATVAEGSVSWTLSQTDTSVFPLDKTVRVYCDWKLTSGTRGRSKFAEFNVVEPGKEEVI